MTALASNCWVIPSTCERAWPSSSASSVTTRYLPARTSLTEAKPRACRPPLIVRPAGSLTPRGRQHVQAAQRLEVASAGTRDDFIREGRGRWLLVPADALQVIAH